MECGKRFFQIELGIRFLLKEREKDGVDAEREVKEMAEVVLTRMRVAHKGNSERSFQHKVEVGWAAQSVALEVVSGVANSDACGRRHAAASARSAIFKRCVSEKVKRHVQQR